MASTVDSELFDRPWNSRSPSDSVSPSSGTSSQPSA